MGIDPVTHKSKSDHIISGCGESQLSKNNTNANLSHMAQWESARLEAEARLVRESQLRVPSTTPLQLSLSPQLDDHTAVGFLQVLQPQLLNELSSPNLTTVSCLDVSITTHRRAQQKPGEQFIDLQSPRSTLGFSQSKSKLQPNTAVVLNKGPTVILKCNTRHGDEGLEREELELKCFGKPVRLLSDTSNYSKDLRMVGSLPAPGPAFSFEDTNNPTVLSSWDPPSVGDIDYDTGLFIEMLLDASDNHNSAEGGDNHSDDNAAGGSCVEEEEQDKKNNTYWNNILDHLVQYSI